MSSDLVGPLLLCELDRQIGLTARVGWAVNDKLASGYIKHSMCDFLQQRSYQIGSDYEDGNDSNSLRNGPMLRLGVDRKPFDPDEALASSATISRFEHAATRKDVYRFARALMEQFIACYATPPDALILDLDHSEDVAIASNCSPSICNTCYLPLLIFEGLSGALVCTVLRPGNRPRVPGTR